MNNTVTSRYYSNNASPLALYNSILLDDLHVTPLERKAAIDSLAYDTQRNHWNAGCNDAMTGVYTSNQQLAAMLNEELAAEVWLAESEIRYHVYIYTVSDVQNVYNALHRDESKHCTEFTRQYGYTDRY